MVKNPSRDELRAHRARLQKINEDREKPTEKREPIRSQPSEPKKLQDGKPIPYWEREHLRPGVSTQEDE